MKIKLKLLIFFILVKIVPVVLIAIVAIYGSQRLNAYLNSHTNEMFSENIEVLKDITNNTIEDSIRQLDKKSQEVLEKITYQVANKVADFLYERDADLLYLSKQDINQKVLQNFYDVKKTNIVVHEKYVYNDKTSQWDSSNSKLTKTLYKDKVVLEDNKREFNSIEPLHVKKIYSPLYKEVVFFDLDGNEKYKVSVLKNDKVNVYNKKNTYLKAENFKVEIEQLSEGDIYVSDVIGEYVRSRVIGTYTKEKAKKLGIKFEPELEAYAGKENPLGKRFEGIIRFITPVFKNGIKTGYISVALDHRHIMDFTDMINPTGASMRQNISNASLGNYAFMWDYEGKNISHPRDYFIVGYDSKTGEMVPGWISNDIEKKYKESKQTDLNQFLEDYPQFEKQSLKKKPNITQIKKGEIALDCRYLNFAPQCQGWMELTKNGGYGSFIIFWSKVWKLTTAASIPYYTGKYSNSKRGFGFVTIGANVDEFHKAANKSKEDITETLNNQIDRLITDKFHSQNIIKDYINTLINEITVMTFFMIVVLIFLAMWMSKYIIGKIDNLIIGTKKFSKNDFDYKIKVTSKDEIGELENSFNEMSSKIKKLLEEQKYLNENLEKKVFEEVEKQRLQERIMIQQSKLASMGEMLGNIAHQWRQPLNALSLTIQNIEFLYEEDELDKKMLAKIVKKSKILTSSMSKTIDNFRDFYSPSKEKELFSLDSCVKEAIELFCIKIEGFDIEVNYKSSQIELISGYQNELIQVMLNILINAKDSFIENNITHAVIHINIYKEDNYGCISIQDNSVGIPKEIFHRIFEPYFSTKFDGTGIGLYMSKIIIENNMNGFLSVESSSKGSIFYIKIPFMVEKKTDETV